MSGLAEVRAMMLAAVTDVAECQEAIVRASDKIRDARVTVAGATLGTSNELIEQGIAELGTVLNKLLGATATATNAREKFEQYIMEVLR